MMKRTVLIFAAVLLVFGLAGCNKNNPDDLAAKIVGQWELAGAEFPTKSVTVGDEVLTVYVDFQAGGVFTLYQQLGEGRFEVFDGSWSLAGDLLSGRYSDNSVWASDYQVSVEGDVLTVESTEDVPVAVYNAQGAQVAAGVANAPMTVRGSGVFIVKAGTQVAKIVK